MLNEGAERGKKNKKRGEEKGKKVHKNGAKRLKIVSVCLTMSA